MVSMFLYTYPYIGIHSQRYGVGSEVNITYLVQSVSILRQDLKLNLELTNSGRLVGQQASGILLCLPSQVLGWQIRTFHPFKMGIRDLNSGYPACKPSTLLTDPSRQTLFGRDRVSCSPGWAQTQYGADNDSILGIFYHLPPQMLGLEDGITPCFTLET